MTVKFAADLQPGDTIDFTRLGVDNPIRTVDHIEHDHPGQVKVHWTNHARPNILWADKQVEVR